MPHRALIPILDHLKSAPSRTGSVIVTFYGDAVVPRGGSVWLGTILQVFKALDIGEGVVRTAMSRLAGDGWLTRTRIGRNSFYRLATQGEATFGDAATQIYMAAPPDWDGVFDLVLLAGAERDPLRTHLDAHGYGTLGPGLWVRAGDRAPAIPAEAIRFAAAPDAATGQRLATQAWPLERLAAGYIRFVEAFAPLEVELSSKAALSDLDALVARILLVHEYRRVILRDPLLPNALLPEAWPGHKARALCAALYHRLLPGSERWLDEVALAEEGPLPKAADTLKARFGGGLVDMA